MKKISGAFLALMAGLLPTVVYAAHIDYAVLFSGGYNTAKNHDIYYDETLRMWNIATGTLGFDVAKTYVLFADGTDPGVDRSSGVSSDWSAIVKAGGNITDATSNSLSGTLAYLAGVMTPEDSFYFWSFDHGDTENNPLDPNDVTLTAWAQQSIQDNLFASWVDPFNVKAEIFAFGQCYSGGMVDDLNIPRHNNRFAAWAAAGCEPSYFDSNNGQNQGRHLLD